MIPSIVPIRVSAFERSEVTLQLGGGGGGGKSAADVSDGVALESRKEKNKEQYYVIVFEGAVSRTLVVTPREIIRTRDRRCTHGHLPLYRDENLLLT